MNSPNFSKLPWESIASAEQAVFLYDLELMSATVANLKQMFRSIHADVRMRFSVKCNPNPAVLRHLLTVVEGFDVASELEIRHCQQLGISPACMTLSGPGKTDRALQLAADSYLHAIHLDSVCEWQAARSARVENLALRIHTADLFSGKLGFSEGDLTGVLERSQKNLVGLHAYLGREMFTWQKMTDMVQVMQATIHRHRLAFIDQPRLFIGPGTPSQMAPIVAGSLRSKFPIDLEVGRSMVGQSGWYMAPVLEHKLTAQGSALLIINGGLQHLGSPFVSFSQRLEDLNCQVWREGKPLVGPKKEFVIAGSLCLSHDILHPRLPLPEGIRRGDWLLFPNAGAYGLTGGVPFFIGQDLPREFVVDRQSVRETTVSNFRGYHERAAEVESQPKDSQGRP